MSSDERARLERAAGLFDPPPDSFERLVTMREHAQRRQRTFAVVAGLIAAAVVSGALFLAGDLGDAQRPVSPAPPPPSSPSPDQRILGDDHVIERLGLRITVPGDYVLVLDVERFIDLLEERGDDPNHIQRFIDHPEVFVLHATRPGVAPRTVTVFRSSFRGDLVELGDVATRQILAEGGTILGRDTAAVGNVPGAVLRSRGVTGGLRLTYLALMDGIRWTFRMSVSSGEVAVADAPRIEASAVRSFERMIRSVTIS